MNRQRGIALIQVLLITGIIGLLMLQMGLTAREQVARAQALADRAELQLAAQSRESALLYSLLTEPLVQDPAERQSVRRGLEFPRRAVRGRRHHLHDPGRVRPLRVPDQGGADFEQLLQGLDVAPDRARRLTRELLELQGSRVQTRALGEADAGGGVAGRRPLSAAGPGRSCGCCRAWTPRCLPACGRC